MVLFNNKKPKNKYYDKLKIITDNKNAYIITQNDKYLYFEKEIIINKKGKYILVLENENIKFEIKKNNLLIIFIIFIVVLLLCLTYTFLYKKNNYISKEKNYIFDFNSNISNNINLENIINKDNILNGKIAPRN